MVSAAAVMRRRNRGRDAVSIVRCSLRELPTEFKLLGSLTANPKQIENGPKLGSELQGIADENGRFVVMSFRRSDDAYEQLWKIYSEPEICSRDYAAEEKAAQK